MIIDSHQHFWKLSRGDYTWLTPEFKSLYRDFLPKDFYPILKKNHIDGVVAVQAAATVEETHYLLALADENPFILGVVGWVDMMSFDAPDVIAKLAQHEKFCGIRPMMQDISDVSWMLKDELTPSFAALQEFDLTFDALVFPKHLPNLMRLLERHPDLKVVVDHGAKPQIASAAFEPWASDLGIVASFPNAFCKFSGLLNEAKSGATWNELQPYVEQILSCFGFNRVMWGSDFPVLNLVSDYQAWLSMCEKYIKTFGEDAYTNVFAKVAQAFYQLQI